MNAIRPNNFSSSSVNTDMRAVSHALRNRLINNHFNMIAPIAAEFRGVRGIPIDDLEAQAMVGLMNATDAWDHARGPFPNFAAACMRNEIRDFIKEWDPLVSAQPETDVSREFWEWSIWSYAAPYEQWTLLAATPEEIHEKYSAIQTDRQAIRSAMIGLDPLSRAVINARFFREPRQALHAIARDFEISYSKTVRIIDKALTKIREQVSRQREAVHA